jgi:hypothetical protein
MAALLAHRNLDEAAAPRGNHPKNQPSNRSHFAKPVRTPRRKRAESPKTIPKTVRKTVKESNIGTIFRMVGRGCNAFSVRLAKWCTSLATPWRPSASDTKTP